MKHRGQDAHEVSRETPPSDKTWSALERWLGLSLSGGQRQRLIEYHGWLGTEAEAAGGIGPHEKGRLYDRHVFDSLGYLKGIEAESLVPQGHPSKLRLVDVGSGVGLPGIPIAIARPDVDVVLLDRAERRTLLARRAVRILGLDNIEVRTADVDHVSEVFDVVAYRASLPLSEAAQAFARLAEPSGVGVFGISRLEEQPSVPPPPDGVAYEVSSERPEVLDSPFWLLRMLRT